MIFGAIQAWRFTCKIFSSFWKSIMNMNLHDCYNLSSFTHSKFDFWPFDFCSTCLSNLCCIKNWDVPVLRTQKKFQGKIFFVMFCVSLQISCFFEKYSHIWQASLSSKACVPICVASFSARFLYFQNDCGCFDSREMFAWTSVWKGSFIFSRDFLQLLSFEIL